MDPLPSTSTSEPDRRGRRRQAILDAAKQLFVERGFDGVSLAEVVRRSGGSLSTLYELFENKAGLLRAVIASENFDGIGRMEAIVSREEDPATTLRAIAGEIHDELLRPDTVGLMRVATGESLRNPEFARAVYAVTQAPFLELLARTFARWHDAGRMRMPDPPLAAEMFLGLVLHGPQLAAMFGGPCALAIEQREERIEAATQLFLAGYGIDG